MKPQNQAQKLINGSISTDPIMDSLSQGRVLPQDGMFLLAVLQAEPLPQTLLAAPPPLKWQNPPQLHAFLVQINASVEQLVGTENTSLSLTEF